MSRSVALIIVAGAACAAAQPVELTFDSSSGISFNATMHLPVGSASDSDSSSMTGTMTVELDNYSHPTQITMDDFSMSVDDELTMDFDFGFFGAVHVSVPDATASYASPGTPTGPVLIAGDSTFYFPAVLTNLDGAGSATGSIIVIGDINETFNLSDFSPYATDFAGSVSIDGDMVHLAGTLEFSGSGEVASGVTLDASGTLTISASGVRPPACPADWNDDGVLDFFDVQQFLAAFSAGDAAADLVADGVFNFFDVQAFLQAFSAGCA